jgi:hypothetical protein
METARLMVVSDKSRGYCLEMICADFLAGAHLGNGNPADLLNAVLRLFHLMPAPQRHEFLCNATPAVWHTFQSKSVFV